MGPESFGIAETSVDQAFLGFRKSVRVETTNTPDSTLSDHAIKVLEQLALGKRVESAIGLANSAYPPIDHETGLVATMKLIGDKRTKLVNVYLTEPEQQSGGNPNKWFYVLP